MGKKNKRYEELRFGRCEICANDIPIEFYSDKGDTIFCSECSSEYSIKSRKPLRLMLLTGDYYGDSFFDEMSFD